MDRKRFLKLDKRSFSWSDLNEIDLAVIGRKSGKSLSRPVWFAIRGKEMLLMPVRGNDTQWYKNVLRDPRVTITSEQHTLKGELSIITQKSQVADVISLFEKKYGESDTKKYYPKRNVAASLPLE